MSRSNIKYEIVKKDDNLHTCSNQALHDPEIANKKKLLYTGIVLGTLLISVYFILSIGLTFYQQWLYNTYGFHFPLGSVICHLIVKFLLAALIRCVRTCYKGQTQVKLSWQSIVCSLAPPGIASGLDVALSNWAISLITVSLYTMTKSTAIIFILGFALIFKLEKKSWSLIAIVATISGGLFMFTYKSTQFDLFGFTLCLLASFSSGLRWTMAQVVMQKSKLGLRNPVDMIYHMQPWMLLPVIPIALSFEGARMYTEISKVDWNDSCTISSTTAAVLGGAVLAFTMEIAEFLVVTYTSSLTLSIAGIFKEICILILAFEWKGDQISSLNFIGLLLCLGGIVLHVIQKVLLTKQKTIENLEMSDGPLTTNNKVDVIDTDLPLPMQKSSSLTNLLNAEFTSDDEDEVEIKVKESSSELLSNILSRRE